MTDSNVSNNDNADDNTNSATVAATMPEPVWNDLEYTTWGNPNEWHETWTIKAKVALVRDFSDIDLTVSYDPDTDLFRFVIPGKSSETCLGIDQAYLYIDTFTTAVEALTDIWREQVRQEKEAARINAEAELSTE